MFDPRFLNKLSGIATALMAAVFWFACAPSSNAEPDVSYGIRIKFVHEGAVYLEAGRSAGLAEGQKLTVLRKDSESNLRQAVVIGEVEIESVASTSSAARIVRSTSEIVPGDTAYLTQESMHMLRRRAIASENRGFLQTVSFTEGSPPVQEIRENLPRPPLPEINRIRGRIGVDLNVLQVPAPADSLAQFGYMIRLDATRLGGTHWNIHGYQRGRLQSTTDYQHQTLTDLINRTYTLNLTYDNPDSPWTLGAGRLYVPWASSLSTMDGFYIGRRFGKQTVGIFGGTNPDPTDWDYDPNRQMAGVFANTDRGSYESLRVSSTAGIAVYRVHWNPDRQFGFFENRVFYKDLLSVYSDVEADFRSASQNGGSSEVALSRSYMTIRLQPHKMISFNVNENYFRNIPTFDARLISTGLLDRFLFQGISGGFRLALPYHFGLYANTGRSSRTGDEKTSWNYLAGASLGDILKSGVRAEYRFARFDSSFGRGTYQTAILDREVGEGLRFELQLGQQTMHSMFTAQSRARFINGNMDWYLGSHYFMGVGATAYRGQVQHYNQYFINLGYRFDTRRK